MLSVVHRFAHHMKLISVRHECAFGLGERSELVIRTLLVGRNSYQASTKGRSLFPV